MLLSIEALKVKFTALLTVISTGLNSKLDKTAPAVSADKLTNPFTLQFNGDMTASGSIQGNAGVVLNATLKDSGVPAGTYSKVTVDDKGRVTAGTSLAAADIPTLPISKINTLGPALDAKVNLTDPRLEDSREWVGSTVGQVEAETGTATVRRAWTAQRIRQAIAAWWASSADKTKLDGIAPGATANSPDSSLTARGNHTGTQAISTVAGLQGALDAVSNSSFGVEVNISANSSHNLNIATLFPGRPGFDPRSALVEVLLKDTVSGSPTNGYFINGESSLTVGISPAGLVRVHNHRDDVSIVYITIHRPNTPL